MSVHETEQASEEGKKDGVPVWNSADPTDGRKRYQFESEYPFCIRVQIFLESFYLLFLLYYSFCGIVWVLDSNFILYPFDLTFDSLSKSLQQFITFAIAGLIGGSMFGLKYLYHVVGRGWWHQDRRIWRLFSPWLSASLAAILGILFESGIIGLAIATKAGQTNPYVTFLGIGFITGYFADTALAKLQEIAKVIFGASGNGGEKK